jgi:hypothetical protein
MPWLRLGLATDNELFDNVEIFQSDDCQTVAFVSYGGYDLIIIVADIKAFHAVIVLRAVSGLFSLHHLRRHCLPSRTLGHHQQHHYRQQGCVRISRLRMRNHQNVARSNKTTSSASQNPTKLLGVFPETNIGE